MKDQDGRSNNGGRRAGAGRKTKAVEDDLQRLLKKCCKAADREKIIQQLVADSTALSFKSRHEARKLLLAYLYGKPVERHEVTGKDGGPVETVGMSLDDWRKNAAERSAQAADAMADFEGEDA